VVEIVYCAVRTDSLYRADYVSSLKGYVAHFKDMLQELWL